jgi:hypothetical protein
MTRAVHIFAARLLRSKSSWGMSNWPAQLPRERKREPSITMHYNMMVDNRERYYYMNNAVNLRFLVPQDTFILDSR